MNDYVFGKFLYELRTEKGLSQAELGELMGVSNKAVSKWEMGVAKPRPAMLLSLAAFFGVTVEELLAGKRAQSRDESGEITEAITVQMREYRRAKRNVKVSAILAALSPIAFIIVIIIADTTGTIDAGWTMSVGMGVLFLGILSFIMTWVFLAVAQRQKRIIYVCYPQRHDELRTLFTGSKHRFRMKEQTENTEEASDKDVEKYLRCRFGTEICSFCVAYSYTIFAVMLCLSGIGSIIVPLVGMLCLLVVVVSYAVQLGLFIRMRHFSHREELSALTTPWKYMTRGEKIGWGILFSIWVACIVSCTGISVALGTYYLIFAFVDMGIGLAVLSALFVLSCINRWRRIKNLREKLDKSVDIES